MTLKVLLSAPAPTAERFRPPIAAALAEAGIDAEVGSAHPPAEVDYIIYAPNDTLRDFSPYTRARAVLSLWAGVERIVDNPTLRIPLARMVDDGLREGMVEYVTGHVLRHHLGMDAHVVNPACRWQPQPPPLARERPVSILGLGELGAACARALAGLNFPVTGWSRRPKTLEGVCCRHGRKGLEETLARARILVLLLPLTAETRNILDATAFALLPRGAVLVNPGRGALIDEAALLAALDSGHVAHATLDTFRTEPLPEAHPFWRHPQVTVTPHVASDTRPQTAARVIAENIRRAEAGMPLLHLVDRAAGY